MDVSTQITEEQKNTVYSELSNTLLHALEGKVITTEESESAKLFILERIDALPNRYYLEAFLEELARRWPIFQPVLAPQIEKAEEKQAQQEIQSIQQEIQQINQ